LVVTDPLWGAELGQIFQYPVAQQRPDLLHFNPSGPNSGGNGSDGPGLFGLSRGAMRVIAFALGTGLILTTLAVVIRWRKKLSARMRTAAMIAPFVIAGPLTGAAAASTVDTSSPSVAVAQPVSVTVTAAHTAVPSTAVQSAQTSPAWQSLVSIEDSLTQQHDALVSNESLITALGTALMHALNGDQPRPGLIAAVNNQLARLLGEHTVLAAAYQKSLQNEYSFYVATTQSTPQRDQVQLAAAVDPSVAHAVSYDLDLVQTQLNQEAAIAAATASPTAPRLPIVITGPVTFHAPVGGVVSQGFGPSAFWMEPPLTYDGVFYPHFHTGLDIAAPRGSLVGATADGVVVLATASVDRYGRYVGYGNYVVIAHPGGFLSLYGHLDKLLVSAGQVVRQGQGIGLLGSTGWSTGPHVHFEIRMGDKPVDPAPYIASQIRP
jgi:murein DD-endopeptidase MepM/ murein hydrolase activator NlpD